MRRDFNIHIYYSYDSNCMKMNKDSPNIRVITRWASIYKLFF